MVRKLRAGLHLKRGAPDIWGDSEPCQLLLCAPPRGPSSQIVPAVNRIPTAVAAALETPLAPLPQVHPWLKGVSKWAAKSSDWTQSSHRPYDLRAAQLLAGLLCRMHPVIEAWRMGNWVAPDLPLASASSDMIRWSRVLLCHTLDAAYSY